jgi:hypothetical protein
MALQHLTTPASDRNNPFIWGHIALLMGVPYLLTLSMAGLAVGDPIFPAWFEIFVLGFPAIALTTWVQWQQPFYPFGLWFVTKPSERLSDRDRRFLTLIKQHRNGWYVTGWIAIAVAVLMSVIFSKMYLSAPLAQAIAPFPAGLRFLGILWAEFFFLLSNVLLQAGISALRLQLTADYDLTGLQPYAIAKIKNSFTNIGWRSRQLLKFFEDDQIIQNDLINNDNKKPEIISTPVEIAEISISALEIDTPIEPQLEVDDSKPQDSDDNLDELIAFNLYVEDILQDYLEKPLEEPLEEPCEDTQEVEDIIIISAVSEQTTEIAKEILVAEEILAEEIPEEIDLLPTCEPDFAPDQEAIANPNISINLETIADNLLAIKTDVNEAVNEEIPKVLETDQHEDTEKSSEYLVEEILVDKFLARIEELNIADKAIELVSTQAKEPEFDDFAEIEILLDN